MHKIAPSKNLLIEYSLGRVTLKVNGCLYGGGVIPFYLKNGCQIVS